MSPDQPTWARSRIGKRWLFAIAAAASFVILACPRLTAQGAYYDELHQAPSTFAYTTGTIPGPFTTRTLWGYPALNLSYVGAIKSAVFGVYLVVSGTDFDLASWRLVGIAFVALGLASFVRWSHAFLAPWGSLAFLCLLLSDGTILLGSRHDWGPTALALALRLVLIGTWIAGEVEAPTPPRNSFLIGLIVGVSLFEKLTNIVLLPALVPLMAMRLRSRCMAHLLALVLGGAIGAWPLLALNVPSLVSGTSPISAELPDWAGPPRPMIEHISAVANVGLGREVAGFILDLSLPNRSEWWAMVPVGLLSTVAFLNLRLLRQDPAFSCSLALLCAYVTVAITLDFLPRTTWVHHWVAATPFQYAAVSTCLAGVFRPGPTPGSTAPIGRALLVCLTTLLVGVQCVNLITIERALWRGSSSAFWDPSLNQLGAFAAAQPVGTRFVATDWGVGTQIVAFTSGRPDALEEVFWNYEGPARLALIAKRARGNDIYLIGKRPPVNDVISRDVVARIQSDASQFPCWDELPVDPWVEGLAAVHVRRFRVRPGCRAREGATSQGEGDDTALRSIEEDEAAPFVARVSTESGAAVQPRRANAPP